MNLGAIHRALIKKVQVATSEIACGNTNVPVHAVAKAAAESFIVKRNRENLIERERIVEAQLREGDRWVLEEIYCSERMPPLHGIEFVRWIKVGARKFASLKVKHLLDTWAKGCQRAVRSGWKLFSSLAKSQSQKLPYAQTNAVLPQPENGARTYDRALNSYIADLDAKVDNQWRKYVALQKAIDRTNRGHLAEKETVFMRSLIEAKRPDLLDAHDQCVAEMKRGKNTKNDRAPSDNKVGNALPNKSDIIVDTIAIRSSQTSKASVILPKPGGAPLHPGILESLGIDTVDYSSKPRAPQHVLAVHKVEKLVAAPIQKNQKSRAKVDHHKGFNKAVDDLSVALTVKPNRKAVMNALVLAGYHCSGIFDADDQDDKIAIIRQHLVEEARQLYDKLITSLAAVVRSKIFDRSPPQNK